jgi:hypothetical protein
MENALEIDPKTLAFLDVPRRGTTIDIDAENFTYVTTTEILDCDPDGQGGLVLTLDATIDEGHLVLTEPMIAAAKHNGDAWEVRHGGLIFIFGQVESEPAFGPEGFFTHHPEALDEHHDAVRAREAAWEAKRHEQQGR